MNRSNPFRFDLRNGIRFIAKKFLVLPLLVSLVCFEFMLRLRETASLNHQYAGAQPTLGDFAMYLFGGMKPYCNHLSCRVQWNQYNVRIGQIDE